MKKAPRIRRSGGAMFDVDGTFSVHLPIAGARDDSPHEWARAGHVPFLFTEHPLSG